LVEANRAYLESKKGERGRVIFKPAGGMFDLWMRAGLMSRPPDRGHFGNYEGYEWPPDRPPIPNANEGSNHGTPGRLLVLACKLLDRAERIRVDVKEPADAALGAVLATDALELTGCRTPTTAIQALSLKHQFEVMAETRFAGAEYHVALRPRLDAIARDVKAIGEWFHHSQRQRAVLNAQMHIISDLVAVFNEGHCFDEERLCLNRVRHIHNTLWMRDGAARRLAWPVLRYAELLLSSFGTFLLAVLLWIVCLTVMFQLFHTLDATGAARSVQDAVTCFFAGQPFNQQRQVGNELGYVSLIAAAAVAGFFHLGIFISYAYSTIVRK
jgi:hypothetical protein